MIRTTTLRLAIALPLAMSFAFVNAANAAAHLSYEQAWAQCRKDITANVPWSENAASASRYAAGGACLHKYGYRLKKGFYAARAAAAYDSYGAGYGYSGDIGSIGRDIGYGNSWRDDQITGGGW